MRTILIDGDIIAFTVSARVETRIDWGDTGSTREADEAHAQGEVVRWVEDLRTTLKADTALIALSDPKRRYFRHDFYPLYKNGRTHGATPLLLFALKDFLRTEAFKSKTVPTLEADDVLGVLGTHPTLVRGERIIVTADKDLRQIAGLHYNPRKAHLGIEEVTPEEADRFFWHQTLAGDPTDGYPGCPKIGPVKAAKILDGCKTDAEAWPRIVAAYEKAGRTAADALVMARVARILRASDYDFQAKTPKLWNPPA